MAGSGGQQLQFVNLHHGPPTFGFASNGPRGRHGISARLQGQIGESARCVRGDVVEEQVSNRRELHYS